MCTGFSAERSDFVSRPAVRRKFVTTTDQESDCLSSNGKDVSGTEQEHRTERAGVTLTSEALVFDQIRTLKTRADFPASFQQSFLCLCGRPRVQTPSCRLKHPGRLDRGGVLAERVWIDGRPYLFQCACSAQ